MADPPPPAPTPEQVQQIQQVASLALAASETFLRNPQPFDAATILRLSSHIVELRDCCTIYATLNDIVPPALFTSTLHRLTDAHDLLIRCEETGPAAGQDRRPALAKTEAGRWKQDIPAEVLQAYFEAGFSEPEVAALVGTSRSTVTRRRKEFGLGVKKQEWTEEQAKAVVEQVVAEGNEASGEVMLKAALKVRGVQLPRRLLRTSLHRIDPEGRMQRWAKVTKRREYWVPFVNSLWHIDGHHKLIRWRIVTHGGVDGKTRLIVYLHASTNNEAATVGRLFREATREWGWPSRVRADRGGENLEVKTEMERVRGQGRGSFIPGKSTHNQRIERMWRDVFEKVIKFYYHLFHGLEYQGVLSPDSDLDLWVLHFIYLPQINLALARFVQTWHAHKLRTAKFSPTQLRIISRLEARKAGFDVDAVPESVEGRRGVQAEAEAAAAGGLVDFAQYGLDDLGGGAPRREDPRVVVPDTPAYPGGLAAEDVAWLEEKLGARPDKVDHEWAKEAYIGMRQLVYQLVGAAL